MEELINKNQEIIEKAQQEIDALWDKITPEQEQEIWDKYEDDISETEKQLEEEQEKIFQEEQEKFKKLEEDLKKKLEEDDKAVMKAEEEELEERNKVKNLEIQDAYEHLWDEKLGRIFTIAEHKAYAKDLWVKTSWKEEDIIKDIKDFLQN